MFFLYLVTSFPFGILVVINFYNEYMCLKSLGSVKRHPLVVYRVRGLFDGCRVLLHWLLLDVIKVILFTFVIWTVYAEAVLTLCGGVVCAVVWKCQDETESCCILVGY